MILESPPDLRTVHARNEVRRADVRFGDAGMVPRRPSRSAGWRSDARVLPDVGQSQTLPLRLTARRTARRGGSAGRWRALTASLLRASNAFAPRRHPSGIARFSFGPTLPTSKLRPPTRGSAATPCGSEFPSGQHTRRKSPWRRRRSPAGPHTGLVVVREPPSQWSPPADRCAKRAPFFACRCGTSHAGTTKGMDETLADRRRQGREVSLSSEPSPSGQRGGRLIDDQPRAGSGR
jgi:hypothetical protein